ncbi:unnamed protein product [Linum tenue]|uniref:GDSL esterase/lipase n=1 Tax=Linum tenue TaxID=586396 RepID=A0AAV0JS35_9ROSI|nr:unnamed protein product [Linum tenue]
MSLWFESRLTLLSSLLLLISLVHPHSCKAVDLKPCGFQAIYNFGDSLSDTGNAMAEHPSPHAWHYPLGMTIGRATGRACDGLLIIDHIAEATGLPFCNPYLNKSLDHSKGANFAVGGTGLLSKEERAEWNVNFVWSNDSLDVQLRWFDQHLNDNFKDEKARRDHLKSSLFVIGGGGNDYGAMGGSPLYDKLPYIEQKKLIMPFVVGALVDAVKVRSVPNCAILLSHYCQEPAS